MCIYTHSEKEAQKLGILSSKDLLTESSCVTTFQILRLFDHLCVHPVAGTIAQVGNPLEICRLSLQNQQLRACKKILFPTREILSLDSQTVSQHDICSRLFRV